MFARVRQDFAHKHFFSRVKEIVFRVYFTITHSKIRSNILIIIMNYLNEYLIEI